MTKVYIIQQAYKHNFLIFVYLPYIQKKLIDYKEKNNIYTTYTKKIKFSGKKQYFFSF